MGLKGLTIYLCIIFHLTRGSVLIWSSKSIHLPTLKKFNNADLNELSNNLNNPVIITFVTDEIFNEFKDLVKDKYTSYIVNADLDIANSIVLNQKGQQNFERIKEEIKKNEELFGDNILILLIIEGDKRSKRELNEAKPTEKLDDHKIQNTYKDSKGPVLYDAQGKAMLYSTEPLRLNVNDTLRYKLGDSTVSTLDTRDKYSRLSATIPVEDGKVTLRFKFYWNGGYWKLESVQLEGDHVTNTLLKLKNDDALAPRNFSYHCSGTMMFEDEETATTLEIFNVQVQPDTVSGRFNDAYDCVNFTTVPIWSGLFVVSILIGVLGLGLGALNNIKTMDKFDNQKTKQLTITVSE